MRTSKHTVFLVISLLLLCCYVQECQQLALLTMMANSIQTSMMAAASSVLATTSSIGLNMIQSMLQNFVSTVHLGFSTLHTMTLSLISGFIMGNMALAGFIFFLLAGRAYQTKSSLLISRSLFQINYWHFHTFILQLCRQRKGEALEEALYSAPSFLSTHTLIIMLVLIRQIIEESLYSIMTLLLQQIVVLSFSVEINVL